MGEWDNKLISPLTHFPINLMPSDAEKIPTSPVLDGCSPTR